MACFRAVADGDAVVEGAFVGQGEADGRVFNAGNLAHGGDALAHQPAKGRGIVVAGVVQGGPGGKDPARIEARRQSFKVEQSADEKPGGSQQDDS
jgi:hypothetical protein